MPWPGTEEGAIHLCSTSYAEQYGASYGGHLGPVYTVAWSPFKPGLFLSASADWTLRLWAEGQAWQTPPGLHQTTRRDI